MRQPKRPLFTIGYSGHTIASFIEALQAENISLLLDIRMTPISRKKGFSKRALRQALEDSGIQYQHIRTLGSPRELRDDLYATKDYDTFFDSYRAYLADQTPDLNAAAELVTSERVCLMCVEQHSQECHRSVVANVIADTLSSKIAVRHLSH